MQAKSITKIVIVGGGTAGWMTAALMSKRLGKHTQIVLIESESIGTVGVGEATLPHLRFFNQLLGIDERDFMRETQSTYKLGIQLVNWARISDEYLHPFGDYGERFGGLGFQHYWLAAKKAGDTSSLCEYSLPVMAAKQNRFDFPNQDTSSLLSRFSYAYHIDAGLYAKYLRDYCEKRGVVRKEGIIEHVTQNKVSGFIESVVLKSGECVNGELFIDCSGFRALLMEQTLKTGYQDWSHWLPCNSALAVACERTGPLTPYSRASAREAGWQWRIPLQHRTGNGYVYCDKFISDQQAQETLLANLDGKAISQALQLRFLTGKRNKVWNKNCIAVGLSSGFLEPLESTSIYLIQETITRLMEYFPTLDFETSAINEFNRVMDAEYVRIRDFLILHYHATQRNDSAFWNYVRTMPIPDSLAHKISLFRQQGHVCMYDDGIFQEPSWLAVYLGQRIYPEYSHIGVSKIKPHVLLAKMAELRRAISEASTQMKTHEQTLNAFLTQDIDNHSLARASLYGARS